MATPRPDHFDCTIIGAGPAGLSAAIYLARYHRSVLVLHDEQSRALRIPKTYNVPGFPDGIAGRDLVGLMHDQASRFGAEIKVGKVEAAEVRADGFQVITADKAYRCRTLIFATGVCLRELDLPHDVHEGAIADGCLRYCPICDGYEAGERAVGVFGNTEHGPEEALFLRQFSRDVSLIAEDGRPWPAKVAARLKKEGVRMVQGRVDAFTPGPGGMVVSMDGGRETLRFDVLYPALGSDPRSELAGQIRVKLTEVGCIPTDPAQATNITGVFAAGDVVDALDQISVAIGHGAVAATKAHNLLRQLDGHTLAQ
ncbi:NAD(P)/FAD-dependent oxidoreductase [soil metagenome]